MRREKRTQTEKQTASEQEREHGEESMPSLDEKPASQNKSKRWRRQQVPDDILLEAFDTRAVESGSFFLGCALI